MNEWVASIQPPGLMKMRLMHHQEHHLGHQAPQNNPGRSVPPPIVALPHKQLHGVFSRTEQGRVPITHTQHGRALEHKMPLIMNSMQIAPLAQALGPGTPVRRPSTAGNEWLPFLKRSNVRMQRALSGCITKGPGCRNPAGLANHHTYVHSVASSDGPVIRAYIHILPSGCDLRQDQHSM